MAMTHSIKRFVSSFVSFVVLMPQTTKDKMYDHDFDIGVRVTKTCYYKICYLNSNTTKKKIIVIIVKFCMKSQQRLYQETTNEAD